MPNPLPIAPAWFAHRRDGERRLGVVDPRGDAPTWHDLGALDEAELLASGALTGESLESALTSGPPMAAPTDFDVPVTRPRKILCLGKNFSAHAAEFGAEVPEEPIFFTKLLESLLPHEGVIQLPHWVDTRIDHEVERCDSAPHQQPHRLE